jgi:hypothetical protein
MAGRRWRVQDVALGLAAGAASVLRGKFP